MGGTVDPRRQWQQVLADALPDSGIRVNGVEVVRMWSASAVLRLDVTMSSRETHLFAKRIRPGHRLETRVYGFAAAEARFPAPHVLAICRTPEDWRTPGAAAVRVTAGAGLEGQPSETRAPDDEWLLTEMASGVGLADAPPEDWQRGAALLARFHELAAARGWAERIAGVPGLTDLPGLACRAVNATRARQTDGTYAGLGAHRLDVVARELAGAWRSIAEQVARMPLTLAHGDCHSGNIFLSSDGLLLIDWDSAARAPGMLDVVGMVDVAERMKERACQAAAVRSAYRGALSEATRSSYGTIERSWPALRVLRALLELQWFAQTGEDFGDRASRELGIIHSILR